MFLKGGDTYGLFNLIITNQSGWDSQSSDFISEGENMYLFFFSLYFIFCEWIMMQNNTIKYN